jgi:hypothetical protein
MMLLLASLGLFPRMNDGFYGASCQRVITGKELLGHRPGVQEARAPQGESGGVQHEHDQVLLPHQLEGTSYFAWRFLVRLRTRYITILDKRWSEISKLSHGEAAITGKDHTSYSTRRPLARLRTRYITILDHCWSETSKLSHGEAAITPLQLWSSTKVFPVASVGSNEDVKGMDLRQAPTCCVSRLCGKSTSKL